MPDDIESVEVESVDGQIGVAAMLKAAGMVESNGEANRNIDQKGVRINGEIVTDRGLKIKAGETLTVQVGKRRWKKITVK